jgi:hypothetical protein
MTASNEITTKIHVENNSSSQLFMILSFIAVRSKTFYCVRQERCFFFWINSQLTATYYELEIINHIKIEQKTSFLLSLFMPCIMALHTPNLH